MDNWDKKIEKNDDIFIIIKKIYSNDKKSI